MTQYFYDTEFIDDGHSIELISIGIIASDGREYYAVNASVDQQKMLENQWLVENVVSYLPRSDGSLDLSHPDVKPKIVIAGEVYRFITKYSQDWMRNELWAYYCAYDHVVLAQLYGPMSELPDGIPMFTHDLMQLWEGSGKPTMPANLNPHKAIEDARWNQKLYLTCQRKR